MKRLFLGLVLLSSLQAFADDLRAEFANATPLTNLNSLKTYEVKDKFGDVEKEGGEWSCEGFFKKRKRTLRFVALSSKSWWSPDTAAELLFVRDGKVTAVSSTSSKEIAFRKLDDSIVLEFSSGSKFKNAQVSLENPERFASGYAKCSKI